MAIQIALGTYVFGYEISEFEIENASRVEQVAIPRRDGLKSDTAYNAGLSIRLAGLISETTDTIARATLNSLKNAFNQGKVNLTIYDDRYVQVQKNSFRSRYPQQDMRAIEWEAELLADDFGFLSVALEETTIALASSPLTTAITNAGNLATKPVLRISAVGGTISSGARIDNLTTGEFIIYNSSIASGKYVDIDCDALTVIDSDGNNKFTSFQGNFFKLSGGANSIKWTGSTGSHTLRLQFRDKYDGW